MDKKDKPTNDNLLDSILGILEKIWGSNIKSSEDAKKHSRVATIIGICAIIVAITSIVVAIRLATNRTNETPSPTPTEQFVILSTPEPILQPTPEPTLQPTPEPTPTPQPTPEPTPQSLPEPAYIYIMDIVPAFDASLGWYVEYSSSTSHSEYPPSGLTDVSQRDITSFRMGGVTYVNGLRFSGRVFSGWARYNLNGDFSQISGILGVVDGFDSRGIHDGVIEIYHDGIFVEEIPVSNTMLPREIILDVSGVRYLELRLDITMWSGVDFAIANPIIE